MRPINESVQHVINEARWPDGPPTDVQAGEVRAAQDKQKKSEAAFQQGLADKQALKRLQRTKENIQAAARMIQKAEGGDEKAIGYVKSLVSSLKDDANRLYKMMDPAVIDRKGEDFPKLRKLWETAVALRKKAEAITKEA